MTRRVREQIHVDIGRQFCGRGRDFESDITTPSSSDLGWDLGWVEQKALQGSSSMLTSMPYAGKGGVPRCARQQQRRSGESVKWVAPVALVRIGCSYFGHLYTNEDWTTHTVVALGQVAGYSLVFSFSHHFTASCTLSLSLSSSLQVPSFTPFYFDHQLC